MMAALICVVSVAALTQFFAWYCHAVLASTRNVALSDRVREVAGVAGRSIAAEDFGRLLQFLFLCPEHNSYQGQLRAVGIYYQMLSVVNRIGGGLNSRLAAWTERDRIACSYFAAVVLDRRISRSRDLFASQASSHS
jgi:hypothetical protein